MAAKIYTKTGDQGQTGLVSGKRIFKDELRLDIYGDIDELNSHIGLVTSALLPEETEEGEEEGEEEDIQVGQELLRIQNLLFNLGSLMACERSFHEKFHLPEIRQEHLQLLEKKIDQWQAELPPLKNFILPGGSFSSAHLHICRTVCRRVERKLVRFERDNPAELAPLILPFVNRLSDYFFVAARWLCFQQGAKEILWTPER